jgi:FkbM family methyltransferase
MHLDKAEAIQRLMAEGKYEPDQTAWFRDCLVPGNRVVDVGANVGYFATLASNIVGETGQVLAFEPSPVAAAVLTQTVDENRIGNIHLFQCAVGEEAGSVTLFMPTTPTIHSPSVFFSDPRFNPIQVPMISLDSLPALNDGRPIDLVKIDVEGYEPNAIRGMRRLSEAGLIRNLICEFNSGWLGRNNTAPEDLLSQVTGMGFQVCRQTERTLHGAGKDAWTLQDFWFNFRPA